MATLDIFNNDAFRLAELSDTITDLPNVPTLIGDLGLFQEAGIATTVMMIERRGSSIKLVPVSPRGGVPEPVTRGPRKMFPLALFHMSESWSVMADEVQGVRAFGSTTEVEQVQDIVAEKLAVCKDSMDLTHEYQRVGAIKGQILDADGSLLLDLYDAFGMSQQVQFWNIDNATTGDPKASIIALKSMMRAKLGGRSFTGIYAIVSLDWFTKFIQNNAMKKAWDLWQQGQFYRDDQVTDTLKVDFTYMNVSFRIYEGGTSAGDFIPAGEGYAFPLGVPGLFKTKFAPADYIETVNTIGLPFYAKQELMRFGKGVDGESQSNPLHYCTLPELVVKLKSSAS